MEPRAADYVFAGAGSGETMRANRAAFARWRIVPRMLRDVSERDLSASVAGTEMPAPLLLAPIGVHSILHPRRRAGDRRGGGERRAAADRELGVGPHPRADRRGRRRRAALVPALLAERPRARRELRLARRGGGLLGDRAHRRHLHPRLEAARPAAGLAAVPRGDRQRQLPPGPGLPRGAREAAGGGPRGGDRPLPLDLRQPRRSPGTTLPGSRARPRCRS